MGDSLVDWATALIALLSLIIFMRLQNKQTSTLRKQTEIQQSQTAIQKKQTQIAEKQEEIARQQLTILQNQEEDRKKEKNKADLVAWSEKRPSGKSMNKFLVIKNEGPSDATNIKMLIGKVPLSEQKDIGFMLPPKATELAAGTSFEIPMIVYVHSGAKINPVLELYWQDNTGDRHKAIPINFL